MFNLPIEQSLIYLIPVALVLFLVLFLLLFWLLFTFFEYFARRVRHDDALAREHAYTDALKLLEDSKVQAFKLVQDANERAVAILDNAKLFTTESRKEFDANLKEVHLKHHEDLEAMYQDILAFYKRLLQDEKEAGVKTVHTISEDLKKEALVEIDNFKDSLHKETVDSQRLVEQKIAEEYEHVKVELDQYKLRQFKKIDDNIYRILQKVSKDLLGHALSLEEHQDFIIKALEAAKTQGVFDNV